MIAPINIIHIIAKITKHIVFDNKDSKSNDL